MANEFSRAEEINYTPSPEQVDLLEALLEPDDAPYPWNTADPDSEAYFAERTGEFLLEDLADEEIAARAQTFFTQLEQLWSATTPADDTPGDTPGNTLEATLQERFAACIPQGWLNAIAHQANSVFSTQRSMADQLVQCVQDLLPSWAEEDLLVLARPFAYAMRGKETEAIESVPGNAQSRDWTALSEIEQARLSLAIAQYALAQLRHEQ